METVAAERIALLSVNPGPEHFIREVCTEQGLWTHLFLKKTCPQPLFRAF